MQIDNPPSACALTENEIWNWRSNVNMGLCTIQQKYVEFQAGLASVYTSWPNAPAFPATVTIDGTIYDARTIQVIKRYNGGLYLEYESATNNWVVANTGQNPNYVSNVLSASCP